MLKFLIFLGCQRARGAHISMGQCCRSSFGLGRGGTLLRDAHPAPLVMCIMWAMKLQRLAHCGCACHVLQQKQVRMARVPRAPVPAKQAVQRTHVGQRPGVVARARHLHQSIQLDFSRLTETETFCLDRSSVKKPSARPNRPRPACRRDMHLGYTPVTPIRLGG